MIINPYAFATGGGGSGQPPDNFPNLTFWFDPNASDMYQGPEDDSTPATADGDPVVRIDSLAGISRVFSGGGGVLKTAFVAGNNALQFGTNTGTKTCYVKPAATVAPSTPVPLSSVFTATSKVMIAAVRINSCPAVGAIYSLPEILGDGGAQYFGMPVKDLNGVDLEIYGYNWSGGPVNPAVTIPFGAWVVIAVEHGSGNIRVRANNGSWTTLAAGATDDMSGPLVMNLFNAGANAMAFEIAACCGYNAAMSDADQLEVMRYFGDQVGVAIP